MNTNIWIFAFTNYWQVFCHCTEKPMLLFEVFSYFSTFNTPPLYQRYHRDVERQQSTLH